MKCENLFCVYYENYACLLQEIELDIMGCCKSCIYVNIPENELEKLRKKQL